ncbi:MAG: cation:proton antiporter, partial [Oscillospiraceae bacterium]
ALIPQAGVAIGLTFVAASVVPQYAEVIRAVILCGTLIYELIGPGITKLSLMKAGEIEKGA